MTRYENGDRLLPYKIAGVVFLVLALIVTGMLLYPRYRVYQQKLAGEAKLKEAEYSRQIIVLEAKAKLEATKLGREAKVEDAHGVAEANKIIGTSLKDNPEYMMYRWIEGLNDGHSEVIYVPTEGQVPIPIMEAGRFMKSRKQKTPEEESGK